MEPSNENPLKQNNIFNSFLSHYQGFLTAFYALLIVIGALFDYFYYNYFGIDILKYASVFDFLVEPFKQPVILVITTFTVVIVWLIYKLDIYIRLKHPKFYFIFSMGLDKKSWYKLYLRSSFGLIFIIYLYCSASIYGHVKHLSLQRKGDLVTINFEEGKEQTGKLIGMTGNFCFIQIDSSAYVFPLHSQINFIRSAIRDKK
jgi:hypothetical protein